jgi:hypothetical protein
VPEFQKVFVGKERQINLLNNNDDVLLNIAICCRLNMRIDIDYPDFLYLEEGRPTVFAANGSHGMWAQEGKYLFGVRRG